MKTKQHQLSPDELTDQLFKLWNQLIDGKINDSQMRKKMLVLLESNTANTVTENRRVISDFVKTAKAVRDLKSRLSALSGKKR